MPPPRTAAGAATVVLAAALLFVVGLGAYPLLHPDEGRHAEIGREMAAASGLRRLLLPTLEYQPYREKPPTFYCLLALSYAVGGVGEAAARAPSAFAAALVLLAVYRWAVPRVGVAGAVAAALVLGTTAGWLGFGRYVNLDMTLTACVTLGVLAGLAWLERPPPRPPPLAPYLAAALGTLVKGPLAAALVLGPLALAALLARPRPDWRQLGLARGLALGAAIVALLYVPLALLDPEYVRQFAATNVRRLRPGARHDAPVYYYAVWLPLLLLPWSLFAVPALRRAAHDGGQRPLLLWALFVPAVLTVARGKLATYVLSALVPLALLVGPALARAALHGPRDDERLALRLGGWATAAVLASTPIAALVIGRFYPIPLLARAVWTLVALAWAAALVAALRRNRPELAPAAVLGAMLTLVPLAVHLLAPDIARLHSDRDAARLIANAERAPVIVFAARAPSLVFYLQAPVIWTEDPLLVRDLFAADGPVFLVTGPRHFATLERTLGDGAHAWLATRRRRLYANRPAPDQAARRNGSS
jgi:4-amino-4-deoxy-L-arabinose transferase-like glycosyltransferase